jgi:anti-sigma-K factor RskA
VEQDLVHDLVAAYALDALDESERREFEEHLAGCEQCRKELEGLRDAAAALAYVPEGPAPPPALRERVLQRVQEEKAASNVVPLRRRVALPAVATVAVVAAAAAIVLAVWASSLSSSLDTKTAALAVLSNTASQHAPLGTSSQVVVAPDGRAVVVSGLSPAPSGKTAQLWVLDGKSVKPAGLFSRGTRGTPVVLLRRVPKGAQVGLSLERSGGRSDHPTTIIGVSRPL